MTKDSIAEHQNLVPFKNDGSVILFTTLCLSRNIAGYKFVTKAEPSELGAVLEAVTNRFTEAFAESFDYYEPEYQDPYLSDLLAENQITSVSFADKDYPRGLFLSKAGTVSAVINDSNHLRLQMTEAGLETALCFEKLNEMDDIIEQEVKYAFSPQFGYLTTSLQDAGTGMKISFSLHLAALAMQGKIGDLYDFAQAKDLDISGCRGDCDPEGDMFKITNNITIGKSEYEIIEDTRKVAVKIAQYELAARRLLVSEKLNILNDSVQRALGTLRYARMMNYIEAANLLSKVRLGILTGVLKGISCEKIDYILSKISPARLNYDNCELLDCTRDETLRCEIIRNSLSHAK